MKVVDVVVNLKSFCLVLRYLIFLLLFVENLFKNPKRDIELFS